MELVTAVDVASKLGPPSNGHAMSSCLLDIFAKKSRDYWFCWTSADKQL